VRSRRAFPPLDFVLPRLGLDAGFSRGKFAGRAAEIRYTLTGAPPDGNSSLYTGPLALSEEMPLRACLFDEGACSVMCGNATSPCMMQYLVLSP
jgi:hypothetical protein